ncbi:SRPBCC family protein [Kribbella sp. NPDC006257]|uniref:SRPBCC family protein n=1 Tax=Kribbella sp. NPDC006257 TaxID=3156738 RepID=UPI0033ADE89E
MAHHEASATVDVAPNILFDYLADIDHLPEYLPRLSDVHQLQPDPSEAQGMEARRPRQPVHREVEVTAEEPAGRTVRSEAWIDVVEENRVLRWGASGVPDYHGELEVGFVADGTSQLTIRLDTGHDEDPAVDAELSRALDGIRTSLEAASRTEGDQP